jgi:hypothetical protein
MEACGIEAEKTFLNAMTKVKKRRSIGENRLANQERFYFIKGRSDIN